MVAREAKKSKESILSHRQMEYNCPAVFRTPLRFVIMNLK